MSLLFDPTYVMLSEEKSTKLFNVMLVMSQVFGGLAVLTVAIWMGGYEDGFSWSEDPEREFHYHPTFMVMGMVLIFMIIALKAVWDSHDLHKDAEGKIDPIPNLISMHSWIGLLTVIAFCAQYTAGFVTFFFPGLPIPIRQMFMPFHQLIGMIIFAAVSVTVAAGISERAAWKHKCWTVGRELCGQQAVSNLVALCVFAFSLTVLGLIANPRWKRKPLPEEESLHQLHTPHD